MRGWLTPWRGFILALIVSDDRRDVRGRGSVLVIAAELKATTTATNDWLANALGMGSPFAVSRLASIGRAAAGEAEPVSPGYRKPQG